MSELCFADMETLGELADRLGRDTRIAPTTTLEDGGCCHEFHVAFERRPLDPEQHGSHIASPIVEVTLEEV